MKALISADAGQDLTEAARWIARDNGRAAKGLRDAVVAAAVRIGGNPELGRMRPEIAGPPVRFLAMTGYHYILVYDCARRPPVILRVLHGARDLPEILADI